MIKQKAVYFLAPKSKIKNVGKDIVNYKELINKQSKATF